MPVSLANVPHVIGVECPCGEQWDYQPSQSPRCPSCGMEPLLGGDLFCGAGGSTTGAKLAIRSLGRSVVFVCVNHWDRAIETHTLNHPDARHFVVDLNGANPEELVPERRLDFLWASPECTFHSNARGGKPIHDQKRMDPWAVIRWLTVLDIKCLLVENVPEFVKWGPLCTLPAGHEGHHSADAHATVSELCDRPDPKHKGEYFEAWFKNIQNLGYDVAWRRLNAADYGDATTRTRFFLQARKDGTPVTWPEPTHAQNGADAYFGNRQRWRAAREVIDWSNRGRSILDDSKYKKTPLSVNTRLRMAEGFHRFGGPLAPLYIQLLDLEEGRVRPSKAKREQSFVMGKQASPVYRGLDEPLPTLTTESAPSLIEPVAELVGANRMHNLPRPVSEPVPPATTAPGGGLYMVEVVAEPFVIGKQNNFSAYDIKGPLPTLTTDSGPMLIEPNAEPFMLGQQSGGAPRSIEDPAPTIATDGAISLIEPLVLPYYSTGVAFSAEEPLHTLTTKDRLGLAQAMVVPYGPRAEARDANEPMHTITTKDRLAVAAGEAFIVPQFGERDGQTPRVHAVDEPLPAATSHGAGRLVEPWVMQMAPHSPETVGARSVDEPLYTIVANPRLHVIEPLIVQTDQTGSNGICVRPVDEPLPTVLTSRNAGLAEPCLVQVNHGDDGTSGSRVKSVDEPIGTVTTKRCVALAEPVLAEIRAGRIDKRRLVIVDNELRMLDIRFRMLENDELAAAMGFTSDDRRYEFAGNKGEVTKQIGNAVATGVARALVSVILEAKP